MKESNPSGEERTRFCDHPGPELRIAHLRGGLHGTAFLVVVESGRTRGVEQDLGNDLGRQLGRTAVLHALCNRLQQFR